MVVVLVRFGLLLSDKMSELVIAPCGGRLWLTAFESLCLSKSQLMTVGAVNQSSAPCYNHLSNKVTKPNHDLPMHLDKSLGWTFTRFNS